MYQRLCATYSGLFPLTLIHSKPSWCLVTASRPIQTDSTTSIMRYIIVSLIATFTTFASAFSDETSFDGYTLSEDNCAIEELRGPNACFFSRPSPDGLSFQLHFGVCKYL